MSQFDQSVFAKYFTADDPDVLVWMESVLQKMVAEGIVPKYILREDDGGEKNDFEELYKPLIKFFAYIVRLAREFEDFKGNEYLANQYLQNNGHFTSENETLGQLAALITGAVARRAKRGTIKTIEPGGDDPDGEILSLVAWDEITFFKLGVPQAKHNSWNINNSSPCYRGCTGRYDLNVGYENTEEVEDLTKYPLLNSEYVFRTLYKGKMCMEIEGTPSEAGIGAVDTQKMIVVDPELNLEITFDVAQDITQENITFGVLAFDQFGIPVALQSVVTGLDRNLFFETRRLNKAGTFYRVRGIIYNKDQALLSHTNATLNIGFGENLRFNSNVVFIIPYIVQDNSPSFDSDSEEDYFDSESIDIDSDMENASESFFSPYDSEPSIFLHNIKVTPSSLVYGRTYLNNKNFIDVLVNNKSGKYNIDQIKDILRKYFIPYNSAFNITSYPVSVASTANLDYLLLETAFYVLLENGDRILLEQQGGSGGAIGDIATYDDETQATYDDGSYLTYD